MRVPRTKRTHKQSAVRSYPVIVHSDQSGIYWVECIGLEGCYSQGKTINDALKNIQEAIGLCLEDAPRKPQQGSSDLSIHFVAA